MQRIVINTCFGGFGLSNKAYERLIELGMKKTRYTADGNVEDESAEIIDQDDNSLKHDSKGFFGFRYYLNSSNKLDEIHPHPNYLRADPRVIQVVEEMGEEANGDCASLKIVEIPDDVEWEIDEYDGAEHIHDKKRVWM